MVPRLIARRVIVPGVIVPTVIVSRVKVSRVTVSNRPPRLAELAEPATMEGMVTALLPLASLARAHEGGACR